MPGEPNPVKWRGVRPVDPAENIPCKVNYTPPASDCEPNPVKWIGIRPTSPSVNIPISLPGGVPLLQDADGDTKVDVEESSDEDMVRMDVAGGEAFVLNNNGILDLPKQSGCSGYRSAAQSIATNIWTKVQHNGVLFDNQNEFDNVTNYRFTFTKPGNYLVMHCVHYGAPVVEKFIVSGIYKNGVHQFHTAAHTSNPLECDVLLAFIGPYAANDYIEGWTYHEFGVARDINPPGTLLIILKVG